MGLAAGFGFNRALNIPPVGDLLKFPFVSEALGIRPNGTTITDELLALHQYVPPTTGQLFFAAGLHFTTFKVLDAFALLSHQRAAKATEAGAFDQEIVPLELENGEIHRTDEGIRADASMEALAGVKTLKEGGVITAGNASQICDGASAVLIASAAAVKAHGLTPLARIRSMTVTGGDPVIMLEEPLFATDRALARAGMTIDEIDLYEVNEAFASIPLAWLKHTGADPDRLNVNGGAISLGHPLGASGAKLMATLVHGLRARGKRYGLQTMCEGGGLANVTIVEAL